MPAHNLLRYLPLLLAGLGIIYLASTPGGRLVPYAIVLLLLSAASAWLGFISKVFNPFRSWSQSGAIVFLLLAFLLAWLSRQEQHGIATISEWITPYPNIDEISFVPRTSKDIIWHWMAKSPDEPEQVIAFYGNDNNTTGWRVSGPGRLVILKKSNYKLTLSIGKHQDGSQIYYSLQQLSQ